MRVAEYFAEYAQSHRTVGNEVTHVIGIPTILFSFVALLALVPIARAGGLSIDVGLLAVVAMTAFYVSLAPLLGLAMAVVLGGSWWSAHALGVTWWVAVLLFLVGWAVQFYGHAVFEKKKPSFMKNLVHLLIGPAWLMNFLVRVAPTGLEEPAGAAAAS